MSPRRFYIVGTDTEVGKTHLLCELLRHLQAIPLRVLPFKPAQSGHDPELGSDAHRIAEASNLSAQLRSRITVFDFVKAVAPGCAEGGGEGFILDSQCPDLQPLQQASLRLHELCQQSQAQVSLSEGAGGLHVPMPGGTWQSQWIRALAEEVILVGRAGLGSINHCLVTLDALDRLQLPVAAIAFCNPEGSDYDFTRENIKIIEQRSGIPCLSYPNQQGGIDIDPEVARKIFVPVV